MSTLDGLTNEEAKKLLDTHGPNSLPETPPPTSIELIIEQLKSPLVYVLIAAAVITFFLREYSDTIVISIAILLNTVLGFYQEQRANNALVALKRLVNPTATVIRSGQQIKIPAREVVPGDVIVLNNGDKIPADGVLLEASKLTIEEAVLTGESVPVQKSERAQVFMGTVVRGGRAVMLAKMTGEKTEIGKIATRVQEIGEDTPLKKQLATFSNQLTIVVVGLTAFVFVIGLITDRSIAEIFTVAVALSVSAIPEGLLVMLTVVLAIGMQRILKRKGLVRNLVSAETLGSVTTICTDKTGTLTEGVMTVEKFVGDTKNMMIQSIISNDRDDPIVQALWDYATNEHSDYKKLQSMYARIDELPFDSANRFAATLHLIDKKKTILINGAPEFLLKWSDVSQKKRDEILSAIEGYTQDGKRVIAMARKKLPSRSKKLHKKDIVGNDLEWLGFVVFSDPVRKGVKAALTKTFDAGVRLIVITGDYKNTALSVLKQLGISIETHNVIEGDQLDGMSDLDLTHLLSTQKPMLFARTSPEGKLKIVDALKANNEVVAMTGDGVNDAPALAKADIGIVVGEATDVAKESSDLVLLDSSFATIVASIEEGRVIFENIRKVILNLLSDAFEGIFAVISALILGATLIPGLPLPVTAAQILYINLVSDGFPNLALTVDPKRPGSMKEAPRDPKEQLVTGWMRMLILITSLTGAVSAMIIFIAAYYRFDIETARSVAFATIGMNSLIYVFSIRTLSEPFWTMSPINNKWLLVSVFGAVIVQILPFVYRPLGRFFDVVPLELYQWVEVFIAAFVMFAVIEILKMFHRMALKKHK